MELDRGARILQRRGLPICSIAQSFRRSAPHGAGGYRVGRKPGGAAPGKAPRAKERCKKHPRENFCIPLSGIHGGIEVQGSPEGGDCLSAPLRSRFADRPRMGPAATERAASRGCSPRQGPEGERKMQEASKGELLHTPFGHPRGNRGARLPRRRVLPICSIAQSFRRSAPHGAGGYRVGRKPGGAAPGKAPRAKGRCKKDPREEPCIPLSFSSRAKEGCKKHPRENFCPPLSGSTARALSRRR